MGHRSRLRDPTDWGVSARFVRKFTRVNPSTLSDLSKFVFLWEVKIVLEGGESVRPQAAVPVRGCPERKMRGTSFLKNDSYPGPLDLRNSEQ